MRLTGEAAERFYRGREKLRQFKEAVGYTNADIEIKTGLKRSTVSVLFGKGKVKPTLHNQRSMDVAINMFHLNKNWVYGNSKKMMNDTDALTFADICALSLDTEEKRIACAERFKEVRITDNVTDKEAGALVGVAESTVPKWIERATRTPKYIEMLLRYCQKYRVSTNWLFYGKGNPRTNEIWFLDSNLKKVKKEKQWYIVNRTYLIVGQGWWIDPEGFRIAEAYRSQDVARDYPIEYVKVGDKEEMKLTTERAIGAYEHENEAKAALRAELARIDEEGNKVWDAEWSRETIR